MNSSVFDGLNENQKKAVAFGDGAVLVVAGAGSGKTTVMTKRVAHLIEKGVAPQEILLLTFTKTAAINMVARARKYHPFAERITSGTFHSIGIRLIKENIALFRLPTTPTIMNPADVKSAFKIVTPKHRSKDTNLPTNAEVADIVSYAVNTMRDIADVVYDKWEQHSHAIDFIETCAADYREYKKSRSLFDYDDLLSVWNKMLDNPQIAASMRARFRYIMVDEHQDSNALQCSIIEKLGAIHPNVMVVGDPAQAIYSFRGAAPATMFAFTRHWPDAEIIYLNVNYRSTAEVLAVGNAVDLSMKERFERQLEPVEGVTGPTPRFVSLQSADSEAAWIAEQFLENKANGVPLSEQAVLVRSMREARIIEMEFTARRIPYRVYGGIKIHKAAHINAFFSIARCAINLLDEPAWITSLSLAEKIGDKTAGKVFAVIANAPLGLGDPTEVILKKTKHNQDVKTILEAWRVLATPGPPLVALSRALSLVDAIFERRFPDEWIKQRRRDIEGVIELAAKYEDLESYLTEMTLDNSVDKDSQSSEGEDQEPPAVISTIHSAKGLEWRNVFIPGFVKGHLPSGFAFDEEGIEEEKRCLYVAVTRAKHELTITAPIMGFKGDRLPRSQFEHLVIDMMERSTKGGVAPRRSFAMAIDEDVFFDPFA
jgi:DNA helicase-2/ATP-dependent DNA helicase PcrA